MALDWLGWLVPTSAAHWCEVKRRTYARKCLVGHAHCSEGPPFDAVASCSDGNLPAPSFLSERYRLTASGQARAIWAYTRARVLRTLPSTVNAVLLDRDVNGQRGCVRLRRGLAKKKAGRLEGKMNKRTTENGSGEKKKTSDVNATKDCSHALARVVFDAPHLFTKRAQAEEEFDVCQCAGATLDGVRT